MIRMLMWLLLAYIGYRVVIALAGGRKNEAGPAATRTPEGGATHRDPVCGLYVPEEEAVIGRLDGERHYFCSMQCLEKFREQLDHTNP